MTENDRNVLRVLKNIKSFSQVSPAIRDHKESYSMSIKRVDFFGHKILLLYIIGIICAALMMIPALIVYVSNVDVNFTFYLLLFSILFTFIFLCGCI